MTVNDLKEKLENLDGDMDIEIYNTATDTVNFFSSIEEYKDEDEERTYVLICVK